MDIPMITSLHNIGYNGFFESGRVRMGFSAYPVARVVAEHRNAYGVRNANGHYIASVTGKHRHMATGKDDYPAVGDWVAITELPENTAVIRGILPRMSALRRYSNNNQESRIIATNIDTAFITESMDRDYNLNRLERFLVLTEQSKIASVMILSKVDRISGSELDTRIRQIQKRFGNVVVIPVSIISTQGLDVLENYIIRGRTYCFIGSSGVGKSSLINSLLGKDEIKTREISQSSQRGMHTTTAREMYFLPNGGLLIDNPGVREVGIADSDTGLETVFEEINTLSRHCRFSDCSHTTEPGCAVRKSLDEGVLDRDRYVNYRKLEKEYEYFAMDARQKREKDRKFGKYVKKVLKELKS